MHSFCNGLYMFYTLVTMAGWKVTTSETTNVDPNHVRTWTGWYNTDKPNDEGHGDDESLRQIRLRGYEICLGHSPVNAMCRDANNIEITFNEDTQYMTTDVLYVPCNTLGLICNNADQLGTNATYCRDYEIKFECLVPKETPASENLGVIGVAAGLSVLVPILCVAIMHIVRLYRARRRQAAQSLVQNTEQSAQTETADLPPSYSVLFGDTIISRGQLTFTRSAGSFAISISDSGGDIRVPPSNQATLQSIPEHQLLTDLSNEHSNTIPANAGRRTTSWRRRFPNMHISIFELFTLPSASRTSSRGPSPAPSYMCTPPPSYKDAVIFMGNNIPSSQSQETIDVATDDEKN